VETATLTIDGKFRRYNRWLRIINIIVAAYIFISPLLPGLYFYIKKFSTDPPAYSGKLAADSGQTSDKKPEGNRLVIPSILLDEEVHDGPTTATLREGVWRRPNTATPDVASNTVMAGHVFTYSTPTGVFYNLGKVNVGDKLAVYWNGSEYLYEVFDKSTVPANAVEVEAPTKEARLTLYTCTPLWNPVNRLIITATLLEVTPL
jgi:LPXTG-site transpeptidase (sortase) family protein